MRLALPIIEIKVLCEHVLTPWKKSQPSTWTRSHRPPRIVKHNSKYSHNRHFASKATWGAVVHCYSGGDAFEVEFMTAEGRTIAVLTLASTDIRLMSN
jgi:hypothetical protein